MSKPSNKKVDKCPFCKRSFGMTLWRHNCSLCNRVVCDDCMPEKTPPNGSSKARICSVCAEPNGGSGATGGSHTLGGGGNQGTAEEERQKRIHALEERMKAQQSRGRPNPGASSSPPPQQQQQQQQQQKQQQEKQQLPPPVVAESPAPVEPVITPSPPAPEEEQNAPPPAHTASAPPPGSNPMLEAAQRRQEQLQKQRVGNADASSRNSVEKTQLLNEIFRVLQQRNEDEPFGLRGMDETKLKLYLKHLREGK